MNHHERTTILRTWLQNNVLPSVMRGITIEQIPAQLLKSPDSLTGEQRKYLRIWVKQNTQWVEGAPAPELLPGETDEQRANRTGYIPPGFYDVYPTDTDRL